MIGLSFLVFDKSFGYDLKLRRKLMYVKVKLGEKVKI